jgi:hypothetical protein
MVYSITQTVPKISLFVQHYKFLTCINLQHSIYESQDNGTFLSLFKLEKLASHSSDSSYMTENLSPYVRKNDEWRTGYSITWHKCMVSQTNLWWPWNWDRHEHKLRGAQEFFTQLYSDGRDWLRQFKIECSSRILWISIFQFLGGEKNCASFSAWGHSPWG